MLTKMLNTAIEIEGLIRILKDGDPSAEAVALLRNKISGLSELSESLRETPRASECCESLRETPRASESLRETPSDSEISDDILLFSEEAEDASRPSEAAPCPSAPSDLRKYFSLNDRYLFSRELFGGDMKMFDSTLRFLEGIRDFSDIEDYFYSELDWDPENPNVASFLEILRPHFND